MYSQSLQLEEEIERSTWLVKSTSRCDDLTVLLIMRGKYKEERKDKIIDRQFQPPSPFRSVSVQTMCDVNVLVFKIKLNNVMVTIIMNSFSPFLATKPRHPETKSMC